MGEIDEYLAGLEKSQRGALERVRDIAQRVAPDASQGKSYGMPALRVAPTVQQGATRTTARPAWRGET